MTDSSFGWNIIKRPEFAEVRKTTCRALEMADEGLISYKTLAECALRWMSEDDVAEMLKANEINLEEEQEDDI